MMGIRRFPAALIIRVGRISLFCKSKELSAVTDSSFIVIVVYLLKDDVNEIGNF